MPVREISMLKSYDGAQIEWLDTVRMVELWTRAK